jgi:ketosteroid isomerase-like protein
VTSLGQVRTKAEQIKRAALGATTIPTIEMLDRQIRMYGDVAVVLSRQKHSIVQGSQQIVGDERITRIDKKIDGGWRVIATHATSIRQP